MPTAEVERTPTGLRAVSPADASGASVATACYSHHRGRRGFWAPTREIESHTLRIWAATTLTADEESAVRAAFCDYLITADDGRWADHVPMISSGDTVQTRVLWSGIIEDFLVACLVVGIAYSLRSAQEWPAMAARRRDHRRWDLAHGRCPSCGYELCGLPGRCCPECGETWLADEVTIVP
ncbi:MAG: hypothetical protein ACKVU4_08565 [Phycisphaerales bacterium]